MSSEADDAAFYYVGTAVMGLVLVPFTLAKLYGIYSFRMRPLSACQCTNCLKKRIEAEKLRPSIIKSLTSWQGVIYVALLALFCFMAMKTFTISRTEDGLFNPFEILGLQQDASLAEIKKRYRELSLIYHPDKNLDNPEAAELKFVRVSKAYKSLTDEQTRKNYEKYGSPDGPQPISVAIGLPSFLLDKTNWKPIIFTYIFIFGLCFPFAVFMWYRKTRKLAQDGVMNNTKMLYARFIAENSHVRSLLEVLSASQEFLRFQGCQNDLEKLNQYVLQLEATKRPLKATKFNVDALRKAQHLYAVHLARRCTSGPLPAHLEADLQSILEDTPKLLEAMAEINIARRALTATLATISLHQMLAQAMWNTDHQLLQLPHFTTDNVAHCASGKKGIQTISQFRLLSADERKAILRSFTDSQLRDVESVLRELPKLKIKVSAEVEGEEDASTIYGEDVVTINVDFTESNDADVDDEPEEDTQPSTTTAPEGKAIVKRGAKARVRKVRAQVHTKKKEENDVLDQLLEDVDDVIILGQKDKEEEKPAPAPQKKERSTSEEDSVLELKREKEKKLQEKKQMTELIRDAPAAHTPYVPWVKPAGWWAILSFEPKNKVIAVDKVQAVVNNAQLKLRFMVPPEGGDHFLTLFVKCDSYVGFDRKFLIKLHVLEKEKAPTQYNNYVYDSEEDDGSDDDEDDDHPRAPKSNKSASEKLDSKFSDSDSDSD
eukprot:TRINITY_DN115_c0_g1::TRINITY_DN115_c0_g1_i1::g.14279::m.14279 TRINITY_DN115_c0_g1::TRINITY_DN115_c0_g1_i1::g.14279  ORF type:complete len:716 (-),score=228.94,sp/Q8VHE0/SEC63_MOUSE/28.15/6e-62,Sec63/PF02889.11/2.1e-39,Sec63/PF02889.11/8.9e-07,DnaJ/PF00226.26/7.6e-22,DnaJ/PF00226.26/5.2e+03 TRINITY_DN115_c0_g1_i1:360-2507(-)